MPADQETIRYTGFHGMDPQGEFYLMREVLGGGSGGRHYADGSDVVHIVPDSKNLPVEFTETRFPLRVERLALATDSGGAGRRRGGLGYLKEFRALADSYFLSVADRSILACWGLEGGRAGQPFRVTVDPGGPRRARASRPGRRRADSGRHPRARRDDGRRRLGRSARAGAARVVLDVIQGKVSARAAREEYGVVLVTGPDGETGHDADATAAPAEPAPRGARAAAVLRSRAGLPASRAAGTTQTWTFWSRRQTTPGAPAAVKPPVFEYTAVRSIDEAVAELRQHGDAAKLLAGGQSLVPLLNMRLATPERLIDLNRVGELAYIRAGSGGLAIGAMTRQRAVERSALAAPHVPLLTDALPWVGHFQIRNRGTVGGSLSHADPGRRAAGRGAVPRRPLHRPRAARASGRSRPRTSSGRS